MAPTDNSTEQSTVNTASLFLSRILRRLTAAEQHPAFIHNGFPVSYRSSYRMLLALHGKLAGLGVRHGSTVAIAGGNRPETILAQLAAQLRGASIVHVPTSAPRASALETLTACKPDVVLLDPEREPESMRALARDAGVPTVHALGTEDPASACDDDLSIPPSVTAVFPTGGSTGTPKLVQHSGIYEGMAHIFGPDSGGSGRILLVAPMSHLTGNCAALGALLCGETVVLHPGFDASAVLNAVERDAITSLSLTPPRLCLLLDHPAISHTDTSSLRAMSLGAAPLPAHRMAQALDVFGPIVGQGYGLTEAPMVASMPAGEANAAPELLGSVGRIVPGMEAVIDERTGEVLVRGLALMVGYYARDDLTSAAFDDGWLHTGDLGYFDDSGYLYLHGRADDVVITGEHGSKVHPGTVEEALHRHESISESAVLGVPDGDGWQLHAAVVPRRPGVLRPEDVAAHVRETLGREHLVPASIEFRVELPLTPLGKVDKPALRAELNPPAR